MTTSTEPATDDSADVAQAPLTAAGHRLLEAFAAICGAPDDPEVAAQAQVALAELDAVLAAA